MSCRPLLLLIAALLALAGCGSATLERQATNPSARAPASGLPVMSASELPREAQQTLRLIRAGGPFPYRKDGATFQNRERILPRQPRGYYQEFTVRTPGSPDRGPRRIVAGGGGEAFYTSDHYRSYKQIEERK